MKKFTSLFVLMLLFQILWAQSWNEIVKISASDRAQYDYFGYRVAISGNYAIVGANTEDEDAFGRKHRAKCR